MEIVHRVIPPSAVIDAWPDMVYIIEERDFLSGG